MLTYNCIMRNFSISWGSSLKMPHLRSMDMSFFVSCPITDALADPHKSGHQTTSRIIVKSTLHVRADLWGHADAPYLLRA